MTNDAQKKEEPDLKMRRHVSDIGSSSVVQNMRGQYGGLWYDGDPPTPEFPPTGNSTPSPTKNLCWSE